MFQSLAVSLAVATLAWWGAAVAAPALLAARALRRGKWALKLKDYHRAERFLERAARRGDLREEAVCLIAESALHGGRPQDALIALESLFETDGFRGSRRVLLLRGVAASALRQSSAAQRALAEIADRADATVEEQLAMAQASVLARDFDAARVFLGMVRPAEVAAPLRGRLRLIEAAIYWHQRQWDKVLETLPEGDECADRDRRVVKSLRRLAQKSLAEQAPAKDSRGESGRGGR